MEQTYDVKTAYDGDVRCVIVDDNDGFIDLATRLLAGDGCEVVGRARGSLEALGVIAETHPHVVLVDVRLGDESGVELITEIVRLGLADGIALFLISSCARVDLHEIFTLSLAHGYLPKLELSGHALRGLLNGNGSSTAGTGDGEH